jgi:U4/U6.U5 tri-snRNP-associated protein 2
MLKRQLTLDEQLDEFDDNTSKKLATNINTTLSTDQQLLNRRKCPYLDTVNRNLLDFDQLKVCSVTMSNMNVYACLVCGKFYTGKSNTTPAYTHSVQQGHFVFMNLTDSRIFCLPDSYEIVDQSLDDFKRSFLPSYSIKEIDDLNQNTLLARDVHGVSYLPGFIGLNNLKHTDFINVTLHALSHITPLRNYFLDPNNYSLCNNDICQRFGIIVRKLWSRNNFKSFISPIEFIQTVSIHSKKRFNTGKCSEVIDFFVWLINELNKGLLNTKDIKNNKIIQNTLQGKIEIVTMHKAVDIVGKKMNNLVVVDDEWVEEKQILPFNFLTISLPPAPLFGNANASNVTTGIGTNTNVSQITQIPLFELLKKYDGVTWTDHISNDGKFTRKQYHIKSLPKYLILHIARFSKTNFGSRKEKNSTLVSFPIKNLDLKDIIPSISTIDSTKYDLISNICHDTAGLQGLEVSSKSYEVTKNVTTTSTVIESSSNEEIDFGSYRIHTKNNANGQWYEIQDMIVTETMPQIVALSESYLLIYEKKN